MDGLRHLSKNIVGDDVDAGSSALHFSAREGPNDRVRVLGMNPFWGVPEKKTEGQTLTS